METEQLIISYTDVLLIPEGAPLPFQLPDSIEEVRFDQNNIPDFVAKLYSNCAGKRVMIATDSPLIRDMALPVINSMTENFPSIRFGNEFIADKAIEEILRLENILVCDDGSEFIINSTPMTAGVYSTLDNRIAIKGSDIFSSDHKCLCKKRDGSKWGCLLPSEYSANSLRGTLGRADTAIDTNVMIAADLLEQLLSRSDKSLIPELDSVLIFGTNCLVTRYTHSDNTSLDAFFKNAAFLALFGRTLSEVNSDNLLGVMLDGILNRNIPDYFINFLELTYFQNRLPGTDVWKNYLDLCINDKRF